MNLEVKFKSVCPDELTISGSILEIINWYSNQRLEIEKYYKDKLKELKLLNDKRYREFNQQYFSLLGDIDRRLLNTLKIRSEFYDLPEELLYHFRILRYKGFGYHCDKGIQFCLPLLFSL